MIDKKKKPFEAFSDAIVKSFDRIPKRVQKLLGQALGIVAVTYFLATGASAVFLTFMMDSALKKSKVSRVNVSASSSRVRLANYRDLRKSIELRNVFNPDGEFPDEDIEEETEEKKPDKFDINARCEKSSLGLTLLGTIFSGNAATSFATIKESGYEVADVYKVGDSIIGQDGAKLVAVGRKKVVINNKGVKECLEIDEKLVKQASKPNMSAPVPPLTMGGGDGAEGEGDGEAPSTVSLDNQYVSGELGEGFGKIIQAARFVPHMVENRVDGFKIFAIKKASLFEKIGLKNGDIVTRVNDISLQQPDQGFALYQALQDEKEIQLSILRGGKTPKTINLRIN